MKNKPTKYEVVTIKRWGWIDGETGKLLYSFSTTKAECLKNTDEDIPVELTITYTIPPPKEMTQKDIEKAFGYKIKIV